MSNSNTVYNNHLNKVSDEINDLKVELGTKEAEIYQIKEKIEGLQRVLERLEK